MNYIFIDHKDGVDRVGLLVEDELREFYKEDNNKTILGNIYRARVKDVLMGMEAAFIDIGHERNAYLHINDLIPKRKREEKKEMKINNLIKSGQEIIVQVIKEPLGDKGAKVTKNISLKGKYLILIPESRGVNISRKIKDPEKLKNLRRLGNKIMLDNLGMIIRTDAQSLDRETIEEEYISLVKTYRKIERERNFLPCPKLIYKELDIAHQVVMENMGKNIDQVIVNDREIYNSLLLMDEYKEMGLEKVLLYDPEFSLDIREDIKKQVLQGLERELPLASGGSIVIDHTEALTAIDVNTGRYVGQMSLEKTILKTNLEAAKEIAKQIRLRDIGGIIIVDFIYMKNKEDSKLLWESFEEAIKDDNKKTNLVDITELGLIELTRKKTRKNLGESYSRKCPNCNGRGEIISWNH